MSNAKSDNYVWESRLDKKYQCSVTRLSERTGMLKVINEDTNTVLLEKEVGLSYGAVFGPDMDDVSTWEETCIEVVDSQG